MKWFLTITITSLTLGLAAGCGGPSDKPTGTPIPLVGPTPISSSPTQSTAKASPTPAPPSRTASIVASCVFLYSPETVRERAFAFDGTVESVEMRVDPKLPAELARLGSQSQELPWVTFKVNQWFQGGESPEVAIWVPRHAPEGVWPLEPGDRLLAAGEYRWGQPPEDPLSWGCGFTQRYTPETAAQWAEATPLAQISTPAPERTPFVFPEPPLANLTIGEQGQMAKLGGNCWSDKTGRPSCREMIGIPTALEPLRTNPTFTADFRFRVEEPPSELRLEIHPVEAEDQLDTKDRDIRRWWRPSGTLGEQLVLPPEGETSVDLSLEPGLYVFQVFGKWPGIGSASYGFLVEVR